MTYYANAKNNCVQSLHLLVLVIFNFKGRKEPFKKKNKSGIQIAI